MAEAFRRGETGELGDFVDGPFLPAASGASLRLERRGSVGFGNDRVPLAVRKTVLSAGGQLRVAVEIENLSGRALTLTYGSEWNVLAFPHEFEPCGASGISLYGGALRFEPEGAAALWSFPLRTLSQSEGGFDIIHQGYCLCPVWVLDLPSNGTARMSVMLKERDGAAV